MTDVAHITRGSAESLNQCFLEATPMHIPDETGGSYKTDLVLYRSINGIPTEHLRPVALLLGLSDDEFTQLSAPIPYSATARVTWWHGPDPRFINGTAHAHNHPWSTADGVSARSYILNGGYTEEIYKVGVGKVRTRSHGTGDVNTLRRDEFHLITQVQPGTRSLMICSSLVPGNEWGHLNLETMRYSPAISGGTFFSDLCAINPHKRPPAK